jgi:uncharacterized membrane protein
MYIALLLAFAVGVVTGLRSITAPAVVAWAAHCGWLNLAGSPLSFIGSTIAVVILTLGALGEFVADKLPRTPSRTTALPLIFRIVVGGFTGACVAVAGGASMTTGIVLGAIGAIVGAFGGYYARTRVVKALRVRDLMIAIPEDLLAIGLGLLVVSRY